MRRIILIVLLAVVSSCAVSGWDAVVHAKDDTYKIYTNHGMVHRVGNIIEIWFMEDFKSAQEAAGGTLYMSSKEQFRFNCWNEQWQALDISFYSGKMGEGAVVFSDSNTSQWGPIQPGSKIEVYWKTACVNK
jgi:hypothetical protein